VTIKLPQDFPVVERDVVRMVVRDSEGRILLFHTHDVTAPELGEWWELPGGGIDEDESYLETALRELHEEAGITAFAAQVGPPVWRRSASFRYRGGRRLQHEVVVKVQLAGPGRAIDEAGRLDYEREDYFDFRWWSCAEIVASGERFYPGRLPGLITRFLAGEEIDEPFERWS
jgi:8-oxo-dGTP pyrophosphatase MutT (NUDIX family)